MAIMQHMRRSGTNTGWCRLRWPLAAMLTVAAYGLSALPAWSPVLGDSGASRESGDGIRIDHPAPDPRGGRAYRLTYTVPVAKEVYWRFKTDFENDFLLGNRHIHFHRFVGRTGNRVVTETKYTSGPDVAFRWETTVFEEAYRLTFLLLNPEQCGQRFHYGHIELLWVPDGTRVTQVAYFDFWGASLWVNNPWRGGMRNFLLYTARWEKETVARLQSRYKGTQNDR